MTHCRQDGHFEPLLHHQDAVCVCTCMNITEVIYLTVSKHTHTHNPSSPSNNTVTKSPVSSVCASLGSRQNIIFLHVYIV